MSCVWIAHLFCTPLPIVDNAASIEHPTIQLIIVRQNVHIRARCLSHTNLPNTLKMVARITISSQALDGLQTLDDPNTLKMLSYTRWPQDIIKLLKALHRCPHKFDGSQIANDPQRLTRETKKTMVPRSSKCSPNDPTTHLILRKTIPQ